MNAFLRSAMERADTERLATLLERGRSEDQRISRPVPQWHEQAREYAERGWSHERIAKSVNVSRSRVGQVLKGTR